MTLVVEEEARERAPRPVLKLLVNRLLSSVLVLVALTIVVFAFIHAAPGGPETSIGGNTATPEQLQQIRDQYRLDDPLWEQYFRFARSVLQLDLGSSYTLGEPVMSVIGRAASVTVPLLLASWVISTLLGTALGVIAAGRAGQKIDRTIIGLTVVGASAPGFATGTLLAYIFGVQLGWFPTIGSGDGGLDTVMHLVLPVVTTCIVVSASTTRVARVRVGQILDEDQVTFARARGLSRRYVMQHAVLKNSAVTLVTQAGGMLVALTGGLLVVEQLFGLPGMGALLIGSIATRDIPTVQGVTLIIAIFILAVNLVVDLVCIAVDPRIRRGLETSS